MHKTTLMALLVALSMPASLLAAEKKAAIDVPQITCGGGTPVSRSITVCATNVSAGASGLPAGFSLQWMTCDAYAANGNQWLPSDDPRLGKASFSGNAQSSRYDLAPGECVTVKVGDFLFDEGASTNTTANLACGTCYVFRAFGHATSTLNRSAFTSDLRCSTPDCGGGDGACTTTFTGWNAIGPVCDPGLDLGTTPDTWPVTSLTLGTVTYPAARLTCILDTPAGSNGLIALAHQLIAAKLNAARNGSAPASVAMCMDDADAIIGSLVIPPVGTGFIDPAATSALTACLANYNEGAAGIGACLPADAGAAGLR